MYIVAIAWLYVAMMLAIGARSVVAGVLTFFFAGLLPCSILLWLAGSKLRRQRQKFLDATRENTELAESENAPSESGEGLTTNQAEIIEPAMYSDSNEGMLKNQAK